MTKKFTLKLSHCTCLRLVTGASISRPDTQKVTRSPRRSPRVRARPSSTENWGGASALSHQRPATMRLSAWGLSLQLRLNSRAASRWARGSS